MAERNDPYRSFRFAVEIDGIIEAHFTEVTGIGVSYDVIEHRSGDQSGMAFKLPGLTRETNITLKRGMTESLDIWEWFKGEPGLVGGIERKDVTIKAIDQEGTEQAVWTFYEAWPCKYEASDFNAAESGIAIEVLELAYEGFDRSQ